MGGMLPGSVGSSIRKASCNAPAGGGLSHDYAAAGVRATFASPVTGRVCGQVLVYFAVAKLGEAPVDGKTDTNPEGLTAATGRHAAAFADRLAAGGLACNTLDCAAYKRSMLEKLIWIWFASWSGVGCHLGHEAVAFCT